MNLVLLAATLLALACGPALYARARERAPLLSFLDGFVLVAISGLVLMEVLPEAFVIGGWWSLAILVIGALGPTLFEHQLHRAREAHVAALSLAIAGLVLHSVADGVALAPVATQEPAMGLALAIVVHSVPVGLVVWWLLYPVFGYRLPAFALAAMAAGTLAGYFVGPAASEIMGARAWAWFQALVAGSILHVVFGRPHLEETSGQRNGHPPFEGLGNLVALAGLYALETLHLPGGEHHADLEPYLANLLALALALAPALAAAYLAGTLVTWRLRPGFDERLRRGSLLRTAALGAVLPGPATAQLLPALPAGASMALATAGAQTGWTTLLLSVALLGSDLSLARVAATIVIAALAGLLARLLPAQPPRFALAAPPAAADTAPRRVLAILHQLVDRSAAWILAGALLAALLGLWSGPAPWESLPRWTQTLLFAAVGLALPLRAAGLTPVAAVLMVAGGVSPGGALALLLAAAAAEPDVVGRMRAQAGTRGAALLAILLFGAAVGAGLLLDAAAPNLPRMAPAVSLPGPVHWISLALLGLLFAVSLLRRGGRAFFGELLDPASIHRP